MRARRVARASSLYTILQVLILKKTYLQSMFSKLRLFLAIGRQKPPTRRALNRDKDESLTIFRAAAITVPSVTIICHANLQIVFTNRLLTAKTA